MSSLSKLALVIRVKIAVTIFWIVGSWLPVDVLLQLGLPPPEPVMFLRLLRTARAVLLINLTGEGCGR